MAANGTIYGSPMSYILQPRELYMTAKRNIYDSQRNYMTGTGTICERHRNYI